jgi:hypothetical protein
MRSPIPVQSPQNWWGLGASSPNPIQKLLTLHLRRERMKVKAMAEFFANLDTPNAVPIGI